MLSTGSCLKVLQQPGATTVATAWIEQGCHSQVAGACLGATVGTWWLVHRLDSSRGLHQA